MMKQSREKILLFALLGVVALWQGNSLYQALVIAPREERENSLTALDKKIQTRLVEQRTLEKAIADLKTWESRSLPPVPVQAQSTYQHWLIELAGKSKLTEISVEILDKNPRLTGGTYYAINAKIKARGPLDKVCDFLHAFHQSGLLHRIKAINFESAKHNGNPPLDVVIDVEGLSLIKSPARTTLFVDDTKPPKPARELKDRKEYESIIKKNLFVNTFKVEKPPEKNKSPVEALPDTAEFVYLTGSVAVGEKRDATLYDRTSGKQTALKPGTSFSVPGLSSGKVVAISNDHIVVEYQGEQWVLDIGKNLRQMRKP